MSALRFTIYVVGDSVRSARAVANFRRVADARFSGQYTLEIVDVTHEPERAERARILTTPTLCKDQPPPVRRVTGDLGDPDALLDALALVDL